MLNDIFEQDGIKTFKQLAEMSGISQNTFTRIKRNEVKEVDIETFRKLNAAFDDRYNAKWFQGDSPYMLVKDYQNAQKERQTAIPDYNSLFNTAISSFEEMIASKNETIASYQKQLEVTEKRLEDKDATIESLRGQIAEKNDHIATLKARVAELRRIIDANNLMDASYPFQTGAADGNKRKSIRK